MSEPKVTAPLTVKLGRVTPLATAKLPPAEVSVLFESAVALPAIKLEPDAMLVPPLWVFVPVSVTAPKPDKAMEPVPETSLAKVVGDTPVKLSVPLSVMAEVGISPVKLAVSYTTVVSVGMMTIATLPNVGIAPPAQLLAFDQLPPDVPV